jgi:hypothetical protein
MGNGRRVYDALHAEAGGIQCAHGGFTTGTWAFNLDIQILQTKLFCSITCTF